MSITKNIDNPLGDLALLLKIILSLNIMSLSTYYIRKKIGVLT